MFCREVRNSQLSVSFRGLTYFFSKLPLWAGISTERFGLIHTDAIPEGITAVWVSIAHCGCARAASLWKL